VFWRGLLMMIGLSVASTVLARSPRVIRNIGRWGVAVAVLFGIQTVLFITSITNTTVANTLVVMSAAPLFAAIWARLFYGEPVGRRMWTVIVVAMTGVGFMFSGSVDGAGLGGGSLGGDLAAVGAAAAFGAEFVIIRRHRDVNMVPAMGLGGLVAAVLVLPLAAPASITAADFGYLALSGFVVLPLGFGLLAVAPRFLPGAEVGLITLLETILGPLWVWLAIGEEPGARTLIGGAVVVGTLAMNTILLLRGSPDPATRDTISRDAHTAEGVSSAGQFD
jgi:drug/metabolite transporter (DMT)-like permease